VRSQVWIFSRTCEERKKERKKETRKASKQGSKKERRRMKEIKQESD
jgi:lipocalin